MQASLDGTTWQQALNDIANTYSFIPGTGWDTFYPNGMAGIVPLYYRASLNLPSNAVNPTLSGGFYSDDIGTAFVNGSQVAQNFPCFGSHWNDDWAGSSPTPFTAPLTAGTNTVQFTVDNCGLWTGVDFQATASYTLAPTSKQDCKDGGWQNLTDDNGTPFKNQGDCVSYVATGGRNPANG